MMKEKKDNVKQKSPDTFETDEILVYEKLPICKEASSMETNITEEILTNDKTIPYQYEF